MRFGYWFAGSAFLIGIGVGKLHHGEELIPAWLDVAVGTVSLLGACIANVVAARARREAAPKIETAATKRWLAGPLRLRVVTTTIRDVEKR